MERQNKPKSLRGEIAREQLVNLGRRHLADTAEELIAQGRKTRDAIKVTDGLLLQQNAKFSSGRRVLDILTGREK